MSSIEKEKRHFDQLSTERRKHGFIPDLDRMQDCSHFYLSPFRKKALATLALRRSSQFLIGNLSSRIPSGAWVLDLGCGTGWFSLELAKAGFNVTAVDLSEASIALAKETLRGAKVGPNGSVTYHCADLNEWEMDRPDYAAVCYIGSLHHLNDPVSVIRRNHAALEPGHYMVAQEPLPNNYGDVEAAIALLIRELLSASGSWFEKLTLPRSEKEFTSALYDIKMEYANWADKADANQSPMNNSSDGDINYLALQQYYEIVAKQQCLPLQQRIIGGIRLESDDETVRVAQFITQIEELLLARGVIKSGGYNILGQTVRRR